LTFGGACGGGQKRRREPCPVEKDFFYWAPVKNKIFENLLIDWNYRFIFSGTLADRSAKRHF
jgi:hypothetical protein